MMLRILQALDVKTNTLLQKNQTVIFVSLKIFPISRHMYTVCVT